MTDNAVVRKSGLLHVLREQRYPEGAEVLADRGFNGLETDLIIIGMFLATPPSSRGRLDEARFSTEDAEFATETANVRIHVERAIGGLKEWKYEVCCTICLGRTRSDRNGHAALGSSYEHAQTPPFVTPRTELLRLARSLLFEYKCLIGSCLESRTNYRTRCTIL